jgi:hypothetical protein
MQGTPQQRVYMLKQCVLVLFKMHLKFLMGFCRAWRPSDMKSKSSHCAACVPAAGTPFESSE